MTDNPFADPTAWPTYLIAVGACAVLIVGVVAVLVWALVIEPRRERRRRQRR